MTTLLEDRALGDLLPYSGAVSRFHDRRSGPLVDASNRMDNYLKEGTCRLKSSLKNPTTSAIMGQLPNR